MKLGKTEKVAFIAFLYLIYAGVLVAWALSYDGGQLREQLKQLSPLFLEINFFLILLGFLFNLHRFREATASVQRKTWALLLLIAVVGTCLAIFVAPRTHRIFYDEDIYMNVAQSIAHLHEAGMCNEGGSRYGEYICNWLEYNKQPNGWPYLISLVFRAAGTSHLACFLLNNVIWGLSIIVVFFIGFFLFKDEKAGLFGALIFALLPEGIIWSNTTAAEPSSALTAGLALLSVIFLARHPGKMPLFLTSVLLSFALQFRPESVLILVPAGLVLVFMAPEELAKARVYLFILVFLFLAMPHFIHLYAVRGEAWGAAGGTKFAALHFVRNLEVNGLFYFRNQKFPALFTFLFLVGLLVPQLKAGRSDPTGKTTTESFLWKERCILFSWFLVFWGVFLFFYAGSYGYGADVRFSLMSYMPLAVMAGYGTAGLGRRALEKYDLRWMNSALTLLILFWFGFFLPHIRAVRQEAWEARADHKYAEIMAKHLPSNALILTDNPNMFLLWGRNAAQSSLANSERSQLEELFGRYPGGVYFHYNYWCEVDDPAAREACRRILERFEASQVMEFREQDRQYLLYRLSFSSADQQK